ncbi:O-antigen polymerase [Lacticaseibacillus suihuaensis]
MIFILLICLIGTLFLAYVLNNRDLLSPSVLYVSGFLLAVFAAILNIDRWGLDLSSKTVVVILLGVGGFLVGQLPFRRSIIETKVKLPNNPILIGWKKTLTVSVVGIALTIWLYRDVQSISLNADDYYKSFGMMTAFKSALGEGNSINEFLEQLLKFSTATGVIYLFVVIYNLSLPGKQSKRTTLFMMFPVAISVLQTLIKGGRGGIIVLFLGGIFEWYYLRKNTQTHKININRVLIFYGILALLLVILVFYYTKSIVGRVSSETIFQYTTRYFGGSIALLDEYLRTLHEGNTGVGIESLTGLVGSLSKIHLTHSAISVSLEFRNSSTGIPLGNVYTELRRAYHDFGMSGVFIFPMILSLVFNGLYAFLTRLDLEKTRGRFWFILYMSLIGLIPMQAMEDQFFISKISIGYFVQIAVLYISVLFVLKYKFVSSKGMIISDAK